MSVPRKSPETGRRTLRTRENPRSASNSPHPPTREVTRGSHIDLDTKYIIGPTVGVPTPSGEDRTSGARVLYLTVQVVGLLLR